VNLVNAPRTITWGEHVLRFKSAIFRQFFSLKFLLESAIFAIVRQQQSAIFRRISLREKSAIFRENFREKQARPNSQPKTGHFFAEFRTAKSTIFRRFSLREKSAIFRRTFRSAKKKGHFSRNISRKTGSTQQYALPVRAKTRRQTTTPDGVLALLCQSIPGRR
jgi:hypothetical protein